MILDTVSRMSEDERAGCQALLAEGAKDNLWNLAVDLHMPADLTEDAIEEVVDLVMDMGDDSTAVGYERSPSSRLSVFTDITADSADDVMVIAKALCTRVNDHVNGPVEIEDVTIKHDSYRVQQTEHEMAQDDALIASGRQSAAAVPSGDSAFVSAATCRTMDGLVWHAAVFVQLRADLTDDRLGDVMDAIIARVGGPAKFNHKTSVLLLTATIPGDNARSAFAVIEKTRAAIEGVVGYTVRLTKVHVSADPDRLAEIVREHDLATVKTSDEG